MIGIYKITNVITNEVYIGQSVNIENRLASHKSALRHNRHTNIRLQNSFNKYDECNFIFEPVEICDKEALDSREQYWIDYYGGLNSRNNYNFRDASSHGTHSEHTKNLISQKQKGIKKPKGRMVCEEGRKILSECHKGLHPSEETRKKMSIAQSGRKHKEESKLKISMKNKKRFEDNPELRYEISKRMSNRVVSEETKQKLSASRLGYIHTDETKRKVSKSLKESYRSGKLKDKQKFITAWNITKNQTEWANLLDISRASIINADNKEQYIKEKILIKLVRDGVIDALVDGKVSMEDINFLLS